jgi:5S rRNA maturation endonuclease (ribonuclease M5)
VASSLGLKPDRYDRHKWRSDSHIISINDEKFYDHLALQGGGGAIDLVMHVRNANFKEALQWLDGSAYATPSINSPPHHQQSQESKHKERKPFFPPALDESKWDAVQQYLVEKRGLPESLVTQLHEQGRVYADNKQNAVFLRKSLDSEEVTGANLRGTYNDSQFKGLATGTRRDEGWFSLFQGEGELKRVVLVESPIDAVSAAGVAQKSEKTLFLSTDGAGSLPIDFLQRESERGTEVMVAYDADSAGKEMAQQVQQQLPGAVRVKPQHGKDWNEQLLYSNQRVEERKQHSREKYEQLRERVRQDPKLRDASTSKVDTAIAMLIFKDSPQKLKESPDEAKKEVGEVLSQSDQLRSWKQSLQKAEYQSSATDYISKTFERAKQLRAGILQNRQSKQQKQRTPPNKKRERSNDLEL